ncbi:MAG TPA: hypothetical protein VFH56_10880 [Acidimicrobiales bacterium]|nr:hypothetical protein [Acidimicrobiales bacterium]
MPHEPTQFGEREGGFSVIDMIMGLLVMTILMTSLTYVLISSLTDVAYSRQRTTALSLANQAIEEVRSLPASTIEQGMLSSSDPTWSQDPNLAGDCFEQQPLDVNGAKANSSCGTSTWKNPGCPSVATGAPSASNLHSPAPLSPHLACYTVDGRTYGIAVYLTGDPKDLPVTLWAVAWWDHSVRGPADHVVSSLSLSDCLIVDQTCAAKP